MEENATARILQSKFFNSSFNTAIFDGPLRVYFSQAHEPDAFKVYFSLHNHFFKDESLMDLKSYIPGDSTLFIMIYPCKESFSRSFETDEDFALQKMDKDIILGVPSPVTDQIKETILENIQNHVFKK
jgi:hypothetical protein